MDPMTVRGKEDKTLSVSVPIGDKLCPFIGYHRLENTSQVDVLVSVGLGKPVLFDFSIKARSSIYIPASIISLDRSDVTKITAWNVTLETEQNSSEENTLLFVNKDVADRVAFIQGSKKCEFAIALVPGKRDGINGELKVKSPFGASSVVIVGEWRHFGELDPVVPPNFKPLREQCIPTLISNS